MKKLLSIEGMSCKHCVMHVKTALEGVPGVTSAEVDLAAKSATVSGDALDDAALRAAVDEAAYAATKIS